jgi:L-fucose isomerase-like protein
MSTGAITQLILQWAADAPSFDTDMVAIDEAKDAVVFWHCGKAPLSFADPSARPAATIHSNRQLPLLWEFPLKPGPVTLARLSVADGDYRLVVGRGEMLRGAVSFSGTSGRCRMGRPAKEFMARVLAEGLEHHVALVYGNHLPVLKKLASLLRLPVVEL